MDKHAIQRVLGLFCFTVGLLLSLLLIALPVWADLEASYYGFDRMYGENLTTLHCPVLMERSELGSMSLDLANPTERQINQVMIVRLSSRLALLQAKQTFEIPAGETLKAVWTISAENIDLGRFVFAHVIAYPAYEIPLREAMCGVFVVNFPGLKGAFIYYGLMAMAMVGLGLGLWLWDTSRIPEISHLRQVRMAMRFLVLAALVGLATGLLGWWMIGVLVLVVLMLTLIAILYLATTQ